MTNPVEFALALSNSHPSGTGSYSYDGKFQIVVENLSFDKQVSIWAQIGASWKNIPAIHVGPLPENHMCQADAHDGFSTVLYHSHGIQLDKQIG